VSIYFEIGRLQNYAGNKQKLYEIMRMQMSAMLGKAKPDTKT
jgi:hypothetical protein